MKTENPIFSTEKSPFSLMVVFIISIISIALAVFMLFTQGKTEYQLLSITFLIFISPVFLFIIIKLYRNRKLIKKIPFFGDFSVSEENILNNSKNHPSLEHTHEDSVSDKVILVESL